VAEGDRALTGCRHSPRRRSLTISFETVFPHVLCPGQLRGGRNRGDLSMRVFAGSEVGLTRTACRAFLLTVLAMGAATVGYLLATAL